jgi:outer membrane receptor protein involved in Fe transport
MKRLMPLFLAAFLLATPLALLAQTVTISGTVVDATGGVVPGATVDVADARGRQTTTTGARGEFTFDVPPGTYQLTVSLVGFAQATATVTASGTATTVPQVTLTAAGPTEVVVVSASRTQTALIDAPATMSVLSSDVLESTPAQNYADLLRVVPGVNAVQLSARDVNLTNRQATSTLSNTQLVLLDGRSIYLDFFGMVLWDFVPSNVSEIKQIEVVRGPASVVWGANAMTGAVNIITKSPREAVGTSATLTAGGVSRNAGSTAGVGAGWMYGGNVTVSQAPNERWSYRVSGGYFNADPLPRPVGTIPRITDPRDPSKTVGGGTYPVDGPGPTGASFANVGTSQPKFDARVDQEFAQGRITYAGGVAGTEGIVHSGIGPFSIQPGSYMGYAKVNYARKAVRVNAFGNFVSAEAPNLLLPDPATGRPLQLNFTTQTFDVEISDSLIAARRHLLTFGGNARRNNFDITIAPAAENRNEFGAYLEDEIFFEKVRLMLGARVDKFGNLPDPVFSPRVSATFKPMPEHAFRGSYNRAFRSPSVINNYLDLAIVQPVSLQPLLPTPFPLIVKGVGSNVPIAGVAQGDLKETELDAYEVAYIGTIRNRTTIGAAFYVNRVDDDINFVQLPSSLDPYTAANPPPGWPLPPAVLTAFAQMGIFLPRTAFTYLNLGPLRQRGLELSLDQEIMPAVTAFANYSWQDDPKSLDEANPYPSDEISLPPTHRFNIGFNANGARFFGAASVNYTSDAFWSDVLTSPYHGFTDSFAMLNGSFGVRWVRGRVSTSIKGTNLLNKEIQQHIFGDILERSLVGEIKVTY